MRQKRAIRLRFPVIWLIAVMLLEVFVFNLPSYHLLFGGYERAALPLYGANLLEGERTANAVTATGTLSLEWRGINRRIGTIQLQADSVNAMTLQVDASDDTSAVYRPDIASATLFTADPRSQTVVVRLSGQVHDLRLTLQAADGGEITLSGVTVNAPVPFRFSALRSGLLWLLGFFVWLYLCFAPMRRPCCDQGKNFSRAVCGITLCCLLFAVLLTGLQLSARPGGWRGEWTLDSGNQMTQELVDAFTHRQVHLLEQPSPQLLAMDNPYDWAAREQAEAPYLWDHCLYNGKYYSYYGIAPVLLLFLPYHLLTGYYFSTVFAILLFGGVGICFLSLTYYELIRQYFPRLPLRLAVFGLLTLQLSSGIWFCFTAMNFYEIAQSAAFCFVAMGAYFLLRARVIGQGRISLPQVALSGVFLSLAVLSRPTAAVYCLAALVFLGMGLKKRITARERVTGYLLAAVLPFALLGGLQMAYNYLRFDSFFDFGIQYSLTINDFTHSEFHARFVSIGLYNYLLAPPVVTPEFPFVSSSFETLHPNGYYFLANTYAVGLIWRAAPVLGLLLAGKALRRLPKQHRLPSALLVGAWSVAAPLTVLFSIWESGYGVRYAADFSWEMTVGGLCVLFYLYETGRSAGLRRISDRAALWSLLPTAVTNSALVFTFLHNEVTTSFARLLFHHLQSLFTIWYR